MAVDQSAVRVGVTGAVSRGAYGGAAPTDASTAIDAGFTDSGAISEDGVTLTLPDSGDKTPIKIWQNGAQVRVLRTMSDDLATISFTMLETNKVAVETYFGVTVTQTAAEGSFEYGGASLPSPSAYVLDVIDDTDLHRYHIPRGIKASVGDLVYSNGAPVGYQVTIEMENDSTAGYAFKAWMTDLKSVA
jgi:hypothetical protein